jgi:sec-independent protein translocase protein TatA
MSVLGATRTASAAETRDAAQKASDVQMLSFLTNHWEIIVILVVILLLFGNRIPGMARAMGQGIVEFKKGLKGDEKKKEIAGPSDAADHEHRGTTGH